MSLFEKFRSAKIWEHPGDSTMMAPSRSSRSNSSRVPPQSHAGGALLSGYIRRIDSGEEIGRTNWSDEDITRGMSRPEKVSYRFWTTNSNL
jgi:hypothetical protein